MKKKYLIILLLTMFMLPFKVLAAGGFGVSSSSISMYPGESKTITINTNNAVGRLNISSTNGGVASVSPGSVFIQNPGSSESITITGNSVGTATISVVASDNFATMDEEILAGQTRTITVTVNSRPTPPSSQPSNPTQPSNPSRPTQPSTPKNNLSTDNSLKSISIEGYELTKVDNNNYSLTVSKSVSSINVSATANDSKATVTNNGKHDLVEGENKIEVIITSESGAQNKIVLTVIRKSDILLEELEAMLKDDNLKSLEIKLNKTDVLSKENLRKIKESKKLVTLNYFDENNKLLYSWILDGSKIDDNDKFNTEITFDSPNSSKILKLADNLRGLIVNFSHSGNLPKNTRLKINVEGKYTEQDRLNLYYYNEKTNKFELVKDNLKVSNNYVEFDIEHCSEYYLTSYNLLATTQNKSNGSNTFTTIAIGIICLLIGAIATVVVMRVKGNKGGKTVQSNNTNNMQLDNTQNTQVDGVQNNNIRF